MNKLHIHLLGRFLIVITLVYSLSVSTLGGVLEVGASANSSELQIKNNEQTIKSARNKTYNDIDRAWTYEGHWSKDKAHRAFGGQFHTSNTIADYATISIEGLQFTLIYSTAPNYGELDVFVDDLKIHTIDQSKPKTSYQEEWTSSELALGVHVLKFVHASGKSVSIDAIKVRGRKPNPDSQPTGIPTVIGTPTLIPSELPVASPTGSPMTENPTLMPSEPVSSPTASPVPSFTATTTQTQFFSSTPSSIPSLVSSPTASSTAFQVPSPMPSFTATSSPTSIATLLPTSTSVPVTGTQVYYVSTNGSDANPGTQAQPLRTIRKAVSMASAGTIIRVLAGNYPEAISIGKSYITFTAEPKVYMKGFSITGHNNLVRGFTITNPGSNFGIQVSGNNNVIEQNDISNTAQDGIWFFGSGNRFTGNYVHDIVDRAKISSDPHVDCFQTWGPAENILFEKNICDHTSTYGSNQIIMLENQRPPVRNITFKNNIFIMHDPGYSPINFHRKAGQEVIADMYIINNTIVHENGIGQYGIGMTDITNAYVMNNIFIDYGDQTHAYIIVQGGSGIKINNNAIYKSDNIAPKGGAYPGDIWMQSLGLVNIAARDFHLTISSPLIDAGDMFSSVTDDFEGHPRPIGGGYDIGAFEYIAIK